MPPAPERAIEIPAPQVTTIRRFIDASILTRQALACLPDARLRPSAVELLFCLYLSGPQTPAELAQTLVLERSTVRHAYRNLRDHALATASERARNLSVAYSLTPDGEAFAETLADHITRALDSDVAGPESA